jgi:NADH-quinone oxidoreductase subunit M
VTLSSIALPLLNGFVGEFLILVGTFTSATLPYAKLFASLASLGMILSAVYMLWMYQRVIMGEITSPENLKLSDLNRREKLALAPICLLILWMGVLPSTFLTKSDGAIQEIKSRVVEAALVMNSGGPSADDQSR